jgi:hypothetical protein
MFLCCGRTTVSPAFVVVLLLFLECAMLNPTWRHRFLAWVEQQKPIVVLLPSFEEKIVLRVEVINF